MHVQIELAQPEDDADIRHLLATNPVPGRVSLSYLREPNYFHGCGVMGDFCQVVIGRHVPTGQLTGIGCRAVRKLFINGKPQDVGYLSQLRVDKNFRGQLLVSQGYRFARKLHEDGRARGYITTIIEENAEAMGILVNRPRPHMPTYREVDKICVVSLFLNRCARVSDPAQSFDRRSSDSICKTGDCSLGKTARSETCAERLSEIVPFLNKQGAQKQFFPCWSERDFAPDFPTTRGFSLDDFVVIRQEGEISGVAGLWDQSTFKQIAVHSYSGALASTRPIYNMAAKLFRRFALPPVGAMLRCAYASFVCVRDNDPAVFSELLDQLSVRASEHGFQFLLVGLSVRDPLLSVAKRRPHIAYHSRLYTVCWEEDKAFHDQLDDRIPYVEIATL